MLGLVPVETGVGLPAGLMYQPYYVLTFAMAAGITWLCPQTWDFTRRMSWPKVAAVMTAFAAAVVILTTQAYNPFIYFIF
jgi:alginate O-acetyltransferase complex protein AlgI